MNFGNCMSITSPKITLLQGGNYTLSFDMKMANCYGARLVINGTPHSTIASQQIGTTQRILLPKYSGEKTFRFDSMLSVAAQNNPNSTFAILSSKRGVSAQRGLSAER